MSGIRRFSMSAAALGLVVGALGAGSAWADPVGATFERHLVLTCGGEPISAVVNGSGKWLPAHDLNSTKVFIPVQFLGESGVFTDSNGVPHPFSNPPSPPKGSANPQGRTVVDCTFAVDTIFPDGSSVIANGSLRGFFSG